MELSIRYREKGDIESAYKLITANLRLVVKIAMDFQRYWMQNLMDLIQEGNVGLMQAVKKFDPYRGYKFSYYASFWIKAYIIKFIMDNWKLVKIGTRKPTQLFFKLRKKRTLERRNEASPSFSPPADVKEPKSSKWTKLNSWEILARQPLKGDSEDSQVFAPLGRPAGRRSDRDRKPMRNSTKLMLSESAQGKEAVISTGGLTEDPMTLQEIETSSDQRERVCRSRAAQEKLKPTSQRNRRLDLLQKA